MIMYICNIVEPSQCPLLAQLRNLNVTVNSEIFERILVSLKALKYIFATIKIHDNDTIYLLK